MRSKLTECYHIEWDDRLIYWYFGLFELDQRELYWCPDWFNEILNWFIKIWIDFLSSKIDWLRSIYISINQFKIYFNHSRSHSIYLDLNESIWSQSVNLDLYQSYCNLTQTILDLTKSIQDLNQSINYITQSIHDLNQSIDDITQTIQISLTQSRISIKKSMISLNWSKSHLINLRSPPFNVCSYSKMTGETPEVRSDKRKPRMLSRHTTS